jgi:uncharacterized membrane protein
MFNKRYTESIPAQEGRIITRRLTIVALTALVVMAVSSVILTVPAPALAAGATRISGIGVLADPGECADAEGGGSDFALRMNGDLQGCLYIFVETGVCSPSGTYRETGHEIFVGRYNGEFGTFSTTYKFEAKYQDCPNLVGEIFGRCQHPITAGSGQGVFAGVTGRFNMKDDIEEGDFPYRGHLRY